MLDGGLLTGGLYLLAGAPGTGKTVLSNNLAYERARRGQRALYVTLLAESHGRMVANVASFGFFDARAVGAGVVYVSGYQELRERGLEGLRALIEHELHRLGPAVVVLDGIGTVSEAAASIADFRMFVNKLRTGLELHRAVGVLCMPPPLGEHEATQTMADGVIVLAERLVARRSVRELTVTKYRGSCHLGGQHLFEIMRHGVVVYPRSEAVLGRVPVRAQRPKGRLRIGVAPIDQMLGGGLFGASTTAVVGAPGSGKTLLGLHFLAAGAARGERGLYFGFSEAPAHLVHQAEGVGIPLRRLCERGLVELAWTPPYENLLDPLLIDILTRVRERRVKRLFVDGLDGLAMSIAFEERIPYAMPAFANELKARDVTMLVSVESPLIGSDHSPRLGPESAFVENLVVLRYVELRSQLTRFVSIVKVRGSDFDASIREFRIGPRGFEVSERLATADSVPESPGRGAGGEKPATRRRGRGPGR